MKNYLLLAGIIACLPAGVQSQDIPVSVTVFKAGDLEGINKELELAELTEGIRQLNIVPDSDGGIVTRGSLRGLEKGHVRIRGYCGERCVFMPDPVVDKGRFITIQGDAKLHLEKIKVSGFRSSGNGGAILALDDSEIRIKYSTFEDNWAGGGGGALYTFGNAFAKIEYTGFRYNSADFFGDHIAVDYQPRMMFPALEGVGNYYIGGLGSTAIDNPGGFLEFNSDTILHDGGINSIDTVRMHNLSMNFDIPFRQQVQRSHSSGPKLQAQCNDFGSGTFVSAGYNISSDDSCSLDQPTDLPSTDSKIQVSEEGVPVPMPGSPAIDSGPISAIKRDDSALAILPCGYKDHTGIARPQDANGDGVFECDRGAIEVVGKGEVVAGHSSVFFNPLRNGEGNYVEILPNGLAVVYTFTYNPLGTGPAWFLGVGNVVGNSIVVNDLFRPFGTSFGDDFDTNEVEYTPAGSMSMVFPDCQASAPGGNVAYTGHPGLGYEALISRATRLAHITGCGTEVPTANVGLSGSFFDPARDGEGLIIEWLTNGDVLAVFFTFDTEGNQFWVFGQAAANGKTVTINAIYPTAFTPWGEAYDPNDVNLGSWGTFTLTWTDCNTLIFDYDSTVGDFGKGTLNYTRLGSLAETECPAFP